MDHERARWCTPSTDAECSGSCTTLRNAGQHSAVLPNVSERPAHLAAHWTWGDSAVLARSRAWPRAER
jgi:hypothetical protein